MANIVIIGAGLAGLALAQGLRGSGFDVRVDERDDSAVHRGHGYRISLKEAGVQALRNCLPPDLFNLLHATSLHQATRMIFMDEGLRPKFAKDIPVSPAHGFGVNRLTLREVLLARLGDTVHFRHAFHHYEPGGRAVFTDGSTADADLLVGADGTGSAVRGQLLPDATHDELGHAVYGRTPLRDDTLDWLPDELMDTFNRVTAPNGTTMSVATCRTLEPIPDAVARLAPDVELTDLPGYLSWTISLPDDRLRDAPPAGLHDHALALAADLHPALHRVVAEADIAATFFVAIRSANPVEPWDGPITLVGDAVHTMSPGRGEGANIALRDADILASALRAEPPTAAARAYERQMFDYGFAAVEQSRHHPFARR